MGKGSRSIPIRKISHARIDGGLQCRAPIRFLRDEILQNINLVEISRQCVRHYLQLNGAGLLEAHGADVVESLSRNLPLSQSRA